MLIYIRIIIISQGLDFMIILAVWILVRYTKTPYK